MRGSRGTGRALLGSGVRPWSAAWSSTWRVRPVALALIAIAALAAPVWVYDGAVGRAAGNAALAADVAACPASVGLDVVREVAVPGVPADPDAAPPPALQLDSGTAALDAAVGSGARTRVITLIAGTFDLRDPVTNKTVPVQLISRTDAAAHVQVTATSGSKTGVFVQSLSLPQLGMNGPGPVEVVGPSGSVDLQVDGVITDLDTGYDAAYWCPLNPLIYGRQGVNETPLMIVEQATLLAISARTHLLGVAAEWEYPPDPTTWNLRSAPGQLARFVAVTQDIKNPVGSLAAALGSEGPAPTSDQTNTLSTAHRQMNAARGALRPFTIGVLMVLFIALAVVCVTWLTGGPSGRRTLVRHGVGVPGIFSESALTLVAPVLLGSVAGIIGSGLVWHWVNPTEMGTWTISTQSSSTVLVGAVVGMFVAMIVALWAAIAVVRPRRVQRRWVFPAVMLALLIGAAMARYSLATRVDVSRQRHMFLGTDLVAGLAPALIVMVPSVVAVRLVLTRAVAGWVRGVPTLVWLAWRRISGSRTSLWAPLTCVVAAAALFSLAVANDAAVDQARVDRTTIQLGASSVVALDALPTTDSLTAIGQPVTVVSKLHESSVLARGKPPADIVAVDPTNFAGQAFWHEWFSDRSLGSLLARLNDPSDPTAALVIGAGVPDRFQIVLPGETDNVTFDLHAVARPTYFPGEDTLNGTPLVVVNRSLLLDHGVTAGTQLWTRTPMRLSKTELTATGLSVTTTTDAIDVRLDGAPAVAAALLGARRLTLAAVFAAGLAVAAWAATRRRIAIRERGLLDVAGWRAGRVALPVVQFLLGGALVLVGGVGIGEIANRILPGFVDQSPFVRPSVMRTFVVWPALAGAATVVVLAGATALIGMVRARSTNPFTEISTYD